MITSLYTAISGLSASGTSLSVISDNIANMNTIGYKASRVAFGDVLSQTLTGIAGSSQVGRGVLVSGVSPLFTQGSFETTESVLDLAVDGDGMFIVNDGNASYYTRAGQFSISKEGYITNPDGLVLQGYLADESGNITGAVGSLNIANVQSVAKVTSTADIALNLDSTSEIQAVAFTLDGNGDSVNDDPVNYNFSSTITVYDSQGGAHQVTLYFEKTAANSWTVHYVHADPSNPNLLVEAGTQALTFDVNGALVNDNAGTGINFNFGTSVTSPQAILFNYGTGTGETPPGTGLDGTTQFATDFAVLSLNQNGYTAGSLKNMQISADGVITGIFTNGQTRAIGQIALAKFIAPDMLTKLGRNLFAESYDSGQPIVGAASTSGLGRVLSNTLELSNVDLAEQFVKMISAQRGFQANSRIITTTDELMQELVNLKR
ncbi:MAG: flagellar hook protein FlgE [Nitrospirae bacterium]|jgi:flagellar hook protein FlgE|nr:flagellar hook protein FlgE [Nitrospirota bacterium]